MTTKSKDVKELKELFVSLWIKGIFLSFAGISFMYHIVSNVSNYIDGNSGLFTFGTFLCLFFVYWFAKKSVVSDAKCNYLIQEIKNKTKEE